MLFYRGVKPDSNSVRMLVSSIPFFRLSGFKLSSTCVHGGSIVTGQMVLATLNIYYPLNHCWLIRYPTLAYWYSAFVLLLTDI